MRSALPVVLLALLVLALGATAAYFWSEARRARAAGTAQRAHLEVAEARVDAAAREVVAAQDQVLAATADRQQAMTALVRREKEWQEARQRVMFLEKELGREMRQRKDVDAIIDKTAKMLREERERHNKEIWEARRFMPEGVRQAILTANELLRADGQNGLRFLKALKIENKVLHDVQLLDRDATSLASTIYIAEEMTFDLDRMKGSLTLCFKDGYKRGPYGREEFPMSGKRVVLPEVDGRAWEDRLPFLVGAHGQYPVADVVRLVPRMEASKRVGWRKRMNALLAAAKTDPVYRLDTFRNIEKAEFVQALLVGIDSGKKLAMSAEAERLQIRIDEKTKKVEIWMFGGTLRKRGGEAEIPKSGYRIQLPGIEPAQALEALLGMVKRK